MNSNHTYSYGLQFQSKGEKRKIKETEHRHLCIARLIQLSSQDRWPGNAIRVTSSSITRSSSRLTFSSARNLLILFEWYIRFYLPLTMFWNVGFFSRGVGTVVEIWKAPCWKRSVAVLGSRRRPRQLREGPVARLRRPDAYFSFFSSRACCLRCGVCLTVCFWSPLSKWKKEKKVKSGKNVGENSQ